jgi:hypothetical protein
MKRFISDCRQLYVSVIGETDTHYICNDGVMFFKQDVITEYHPLDDLDGVLHLHVVPFYR